MKLKNSVSVRIEKFGAIVYHHEKIQVLEANMQGAFLLLLLHRNRNLSDLQNALTYINHVHPSLNIEKFLLFLKENDYIEDDKNKENAVSITRSESLNCYANLLKTSAEKPKIFFSAPILVQLSITNKCQARCKHCYTDGGVKQKDEFSYSELKCLIDELKQNQVFAIELTGGEPLLYPHFLELLRYCRESGFTVQFPSNGWSVTSDILKEMRDLNIQFLRLSLDSPYRDQHDQHRCMQGSFDKCINAFKMAKKYGLRTAINYVVMEFNSGSKDIEDIIKLAVSIELDEVNFIRPIPLGRARIYKNSSLSIERHLLVDRMIEEIVKKPPEGLNVRWNNHLDKPRDISDSLIRFGTRPHCSCGTAFCYIACDGSVYPCTFLTPDELKMGNVRIQKFGEIWNSNINRNICQLREPPAIDGCLDCIYERICGGGCRASSYYSSQELFVRDPFCTIYSPSSASSIGFVSKK